MCRLSPGVFMSNQGQHFTHFCCMSCPAFLQNLIGGLSKRREAMSNYTSPTAFAMT